MLDERSLLRSQVYVEQRNYIRHQQSLEWQQTMKKLEHIPQEQPWGGHNLPLGNRDFYNGFHMASIEPNMYHGLVAGGQIGLSVPSEANGFNQRVSAPLRYLNTGNTRPAESGELLVGSNQGMFAQYQLHRGMGTNCWGPQGERYQVNKNCRENAQPFMPFNHAEYARGFYESSLQGTESNDFNVRPSGQYSHPQVNQRTLSGGRTMHQPGFQRLLNQGAPNMEMVRGRVAVPVISQPYKPVVRIATISPRLDWKQPDKAKNIGIQPFRESALNDSMRHKKSLNFGSESEEDLASSPIFQMLCEISKTV